MKIRGILIVGVIMAVVLLVGTGFSGTVYAKEYECHKTDVHTTKILDNRVYKRAILQIKTGGFKLENDEAVIAKLGRNEYLMYVPFAPIGHAKNIKGGLSLFYKDNKVIDGVWGYYDRNSGKIILVSIADNMHQEIKLTAIHHTDGITILSTTHYYWWGWKVVLTEDDTQTLILGLGAVGASIAAIAALLAWLGIPAGIAGVIAAFLAAGSADIAFIDQLGGYRGVYFCGIWGTNIVWCWHN